MGILCGMQLIESNHMVEWFRKPRTKKRRIIIKWKKRAENFRPRTDVVMSGNRIYAHPTVAAKLRQYVAISNLPGNPLR
jgi:hypothetical protein